MAWLKVQEGMERNTVAELVLFGEEERVGEGGGGEMGEWGRRRGNGRGREEERRSEGGRRREGGRKKREKGKTRQQCPGRDLNPALQSLKLVTLTTHHSQPPHPQLSN